jgi:hypothetical protein
MSKVVKSVRNVAGLFPAVTIFAASGISLAAPKKSSVRRGTGQSSILFHFAVTASLIVSKLARGIGQRLNIAVGLAGLVDEGDSKLDSADAEGPSTASARNP